jgi:hypothetical protein
VQPAVNDKASPMIMTAAGVRIFADYNP